MDRTTLPARTMFFALITAVCVQPLLAKSDHQQWVGTWASAPLLDAHAKPADQLVAPGTSGATLREVVRVSIGGEMVRVRFSNLYGTDPLVIGAAQIAQTLKGAAVVAGEIGCKPAAVGGYLGRCSFAGRSCQACRPARGAGDNGRHPARSGPRQHRWRDAAGALFQSVRHGSAGDWRGADRANP